jgi:hypothetical protein
MAAERNGRGKRQKRMIEMNRMALKRVLGGAFRFRLILSPASSSYAIFIFYFLKKRKQSWAI